MHVWETLVKFNFVINFSIFKFKYSYRVLRVINMYVLKTAVYLREKKYLSSEFPGMYACGCKCNDL